MPRAKKHEKPSIIRSLKAKGVPKDRAQVIAGVLWRKGGVPGWAKVVSAEVEKDASVIAVIAGWGTFRISADNQRCELFVPGFEGRIPPVVGRGRARPSHWRRGTRC